MSNSLNDGYYEAYWPRAARQQRTRQLAPRLATLEGKTVGQNPGRSKLNSVKRFPQRPLGAGAVALVADSVAGSLLDCVEGIGGVEDWDAVEVVQVSQMLVAGDGAGENRRLDEIGKNAIAHDEDLADLAAALA